MEVTLRTELAASVEKPGLGLETVLEILLDLSQRHRWLEDDPRPCLEESMPEKAQPSPFPCPVSFHDPSPVTASGRAQRYPKDCLRRLRQLNRASSASYVPPRQVLLPVTYSIKMGFVEFVGVCLWKKSYGLRDVALMYWRRYVKDDEEIGNVRGSDVRIQDCVLEEAGVS